MRNLSVTTGEPDRSCQGGAIDPVIALSPPAARRHVVRTRARRFATFPSCLRTVLRWRRPARSSRSLSSARAATMDRKNTQGRRFWRSVRAMWRTASFVQQRVRSASHLARKEWSEGRDQGECCWCALAASASRTTTIRRQWRRGRRTAVSRHAQRHGPPKENAIGCLRNLSVKEPSQLSIVKAGGIEPIIALLKTGTNARRENACGTMRNIAIPPASRPAIGKAGRGGGTRAVP